MTGLLLDKNGREKLSAKARPVKVLCPECGRTAHQARNGDWRCVAVKLPVCQARGVTLPNGDRMTTRATAPPIVGPQPTMPLPPAEIAVFNRALAALGEDARESVVSLFQNAGRRSEKRRIMRRLHRVTNAGIRRHQRVMRGAGIMPRVKP